MDQKEIGEVLVRGFVALDISREEVETAIREVRSSSTEEEARARYDRFKARVKARYRQKALECHPDRGGSKEAFNEFGQLLKALESLDVAPRGRVPSRPVARSGMHVRVVVVQSSSPWSGSSTTTTTSNGYPPTGFGF